MRAWPRVLVAEMEMRNNGQNLVIGGMWRSKEGGQG